MAKISLAREFVACPRHEPKGCPRCHESGLRPLKHGTRYREPAGSTSVRTGTPLVRSRGNGEHYYVNCLPSFAVATSVMVETVGM